MSLVENLQIPEFNEFKLKPNNTLCTAIDSTRLMVEILWWLTKAPGEFGESEYSSKILIDWEYAIVIRYKREKDGKYHPACTLSFDEDESWNVVINQIQWSKDKHIAFRFHSSFNNLAFYMKMMEETFSKRGIYVYVKDIPDWLEWASYSSKAYNSYNILRTAIIGLNRKYNLKNNH